VLRPSAPLSSGTSFDADDVDRTRFGVERSCYFDLLADVLLGLVLIVELVGRVRRFIFQDVALLRLKQSCP